MNKDSANDQKGIFACLPRNETSRRLGEEKTSLIWVAIENSSISICVGNHWCHSKWTQEILCLFVYTYIEILAFAFFQFSNFFNWLLKCIKLLMSEPSDQLLPYNRLVFEIALSFNWLVAYNFCYRRIFWLWQWTCYYVLEVFIWSRSC